MRLTEDERLVLAEPLYEAWRLGKYGAQEYEPMWHELDNPPTSTPEHESLYVAVERILTAHRARSVDMEARIRDAWEQAHAEFCPRGGPVLDVCSTHLRPGDRHLLAKPALLDAAPAGGAE